MSTPSLATVLRQAIDARLVDVHTSMPGRVVSYDVATERATVQPLLKRGRRDEDGARIARALPIAPDVPVCFPVGAAGGLTFPIAVGDTGMLQFTEAGLDIWLAGDGRIVDPGDDRRFTLSDAAFYPGMRTTPIGELGAAEGAVVLAGDDVRLGDATASDAVVLEGALTALADVFDNWIVAPTDGGAALKTLLTALLGTGWPGTGFASKVKAK